MFVEYDNRGIEVARFEQFTEGKINQLIALYGEENAATILNTLKESEEIWIKEENFEVRFVKESS